jgi:ABC-type branched-subunit amino acid transport system substrate-binding protein
VSEARHGNELARAGARCADLLLAAIARSSGTRSSVVKQLFQTRETDEILGSFHFGRNGDTASGTVTIYRIKHGTPTIFAVITPNAALTR